jgi:general stress protein 26
MRILDASAGFSAPLTEREAKKFLSESKLNVHIATLDEKGHPNIHPTWYYFDSSKEKIYIETSRDSKKALNLRKNNTVYFCVDAPNVPYKGVRGKGTVRIHEDIEYNIPITEKIMLRYLGSAEHPIARTLIGYVKKGDAVILEIIPTYFSTWDDSKISQG